MQQLQQPFSQIEVPTTQYSIAVHRSSYVRDALFASGQTASTSRHSRTSEHRWKEWNMLVCAVIRALCTVIDMPCAIFSGLQAKSSGSSSSGDKRSIGPSPVQGLSLAHLASTPSPTSTQVGVQFPALRVMRAWSGCGKQMCHSRTLCPSHMVAAWHITGSTHGMHVLWPLGEAFMIMLKYMHDGIPVQAQEEHLFMCQHGASIMHKIVRSVCGFRTETNESHSNSCLIYV
jgi:hypothetical protein